MQYTTFNTIPMWTKTASDLTRRACLGTLFKQMLTEGHFFIVYVTDDTPSSGYPEKGTTVEDTSRNKPHAIVLFRTDPERYGVEIFSRVREWLGIRKGVGNANIDLLDLKTLPVEEARRRVREAIEKGVHVFLEKRAVRNFRQIVEDHHLARMLGDPFYNLVWEYKITCVRKGGKTEARIRFAEAGYIPSEDIPREALEASNRLRESVT